MAPSSRNLIIANALALVLALVFDWEAGWLLWTYWVQSLVVGWYARKRMLTVARFSTEGFTSNGQRVPENERGKRSTANFFAIHYGFFHLAYLVFLASQHRVDGWRDLSILLACGISFVYSQRATYAAQHASDLRGKPNLGALMFTPYLRVVPMHLAIMFGGGIEAGPALLIVFTVLKTLSDIGLDAIDRRMAAKSADKTATLPRVVE